jgi:hypothetical protein
MVGAGAAGYQEDAPAVGERDVPGLAALLMQLRVTRLMGQRALRGHGRRVVDRGGHGKMPPLLNEFMARVRSATARSRSSSVARRT